MADEEKRLSAEEQEKICARARKRFEAALSAESDNRKEALEDWKFRNGDQWDDYAKRIRGDRPQLTVNKSNTFVHQIVNDQRQNRPSIDVSPKGNRAEKKTAEIIKGYIREQERESNADIAYDTGFDGAVTAGFGYWRIVAEFEDEHSMNQVLRVKRIRNAFTVYLDCARQQPDGSDAKWGFLTDMMPRSEFEEEHPDADPGPWDLGGVGDNYKNWQGANDLRLAEYLEIETEDRRLVELANGHVGYFDELDDSIKESLAKDPKQIIDDREAKSHHVMWYKLTGKEVLKHRKLPIQWIPIVECIGDEFDIEGKMIRRGMMRDFKGPQKIYNYSSTAIIEVTALQAKAPYVAAEGQISGKNKQRWDEANRTNYPYLEYNPVSSEGHLLPPPHREPPPQLSPAWIQVQANAAQDMMAVTGVRFDSTLAERTQDESGLALQRLALHQTIGSFHYIDNFRRSLEHTARIMIAWTPKLIHKRREVMSIADDGSEKRVFLDPMAPKSYQLEQGKDGKPIEVYNLTIGQYEVTATIGPNYATKMQEATHGMMEYAKAFPQTAPLIADLVAKDQPWQGSDEIARRVAMTLPPGMIQPEESDLSPQVQALIRSQQMQLQQAQQQMQAMGQALQDKTADRAVDQDKINKDFEVKLLQILEKRDATVLTHLRAEMEAIRSLEQNKGNGKDEAHA